MNLSLWKDGKNIFRKKHIMNIACKLQIGKLQIIYTKSDPAFKGNKVVLFTVWDAGGVEYERNYCSIS
ncbi:Uncharacterised protein [Dorea longicatena]|nr:Uncharacterised protein [Dorea longicatena]